MDDSTELIISDTEENENLAAGSKSATYRSTNLRIFGDSSHFLQHGSHLNLDDRLSSKEPSSVTDTRSAVNQALRAKFMTSPESLNGRIFTTGEQESVPLI